MSPNSKKLYVQVEEFDIGDEMKSAPVRTWMMKKDPEIDPGVFFHLVETIQNCRIYFSIFH